MTDDAMYRNVQMRDPLRQRPLVSLAGGPLDAIARGYVPTKLSVAVARNGAVWFDLVSSCLKAGARWTRELGLSHNGRWVVSELAVNT